MRSLERVISMLQVIHVSFQTLESFAVPAEPVLQLEYVSLCRCLFGRVDRLRGIDPLFLCLKFHASGVVVFD